MTAQEIIDGCEDFDCKCGGEYCVRKYTSDGGAVMGWASRVYCNKCGVLGCFEVIEDG